MKYEKKAGQRRFDKKKRDNVKQIAPAIDEHRWYVLANEIQYGPLSFGYLKKLAEEGILQTNIQVRAIGSAKWLRPEDIPELFSVMATSEADNWVAENSAAAEDRSQARAPNTLNHDEQSPAPQEREPRRRTIDYLAQIWPGIRSLSVPSWLIRFLGSVAIIVAAATIIAWVDANHSLRAAATMLSYFLIWVLAIIACVWMWVGGRQSTVAWQQDLSGALHQRLSRISWDSKTLRQLLSGLRQRLSRPTWAAPVAVIAVTIVTSGAVLYQIGGFGKSPPIQPSDQKAEKYTLQGFSGGQALDKAGAIKKAVFTDASIENTLMRNEIYRSVRASAPHVYAQIFQKFKVGMQKGKSAADLNTEVKPIVHGVFSAALPYASDDNLFRFTRFFIKEATILKHENPSDCYFIVNPQMANRRLIQKIRSRHPELTEQETQIQAQILRSFAGKTRALPNAINVSLPLERLRRRLRRRKGVDMDLLAKDNVAPDRHNIYCATLIAMYEETLKLPKLEAVSLLRYFFAPK